MTTARMTRTADGRSYRVEFPFDRFVVDQIKVIVPAHSRTYDPRKKSWYIAPAYERIVHRLLEDVFIHVEMDNERASSSPPQSDNRSPEEYTTLHLLPSAPPELVESAYKCLSRLYHPDRGGDPEQMVAINSAVETIRRRLA